ncbi:MAG: DUF1223 domain-containing protein [Methylophilaceae bacterium]
MHIKSVITGLLSSLLLISQGQAFSGECSAKSGSKTVPLLELYTSEGCSSCPPADKWLSKINQGKDEVTPLAFHVDYWDYIGWKDKFSKAEYSNRQRKTAAFGGQGFVYTPQFVFNGRDFKGWDNSRLNAAINQSQKFAARANLTLDAINGEDGSITLKASAEATNPADAKEADVFVVLYENGLVTNVKAGENVGRELKHDYVVRKLFGAYQINSLNQFNKQFKLGSTWKGRDAGAVIFMQNTRNGKIIQSLALPFCS